MVSSKEKRKIGLEEAAIDLPRGIEVITVENYDLPSPYLNQRRSLRFRSSKKFEEVLLEMLNLYDVADFPRLYEIEMVKKMIQILEKGFRLKIKICMNCGYFYDTLPPGIIVGEGVRDEYFHCKYREVCMVPEEEEHFKVKPCATSCGYWVLEEVKEVSEKSGDKSSVRSESERFWRNHAHQ